MSSPEVEHDHVPQHWATIVLKPRVDSFNQAELVNEMKEAVERGAKKIALDLRQNRFVSVAAIKACVDLANELADVGGVMALVGCPERTKRHFEVYGSLDHIRIVRTEADLDKKYERPSSGRFITKVNSPEAS